jgi:hypothetical protein
MTQRPDPNMFKYEDIFNYSDINPATPADQGGFISQSTTFILPKGTLLFSYDNIFEGRNNENTFRGMSDNEKNGILLQQLFRMFASDYFTYDRLTNRFMVKSAKTSCRYKYFYTTPFNGLGVEGRSQNFNCCWVVTTCCDIAVSELISGVSNDVGNFANNSLQMNHYFTSIGSDTIPLNFQSDKSNLKDQNICHGQGNNIIPINGKNIPNYKKKNCADIDMNSTLAVDTHCYNQEYLKNMGITGIKCIVDIDSIMTIRNVSKPNNVLLPSGNYLYTEDMPVINLTPALQASRDATENLWNIPTPTGPGLNLSYYPLFNITASLTDRYYTNVNNNNITVSLPEYALDPFGPTHVDFRRMFHHPNDEMIRSFKYSFQANPVDLNGYLGIGTRPGAHDWTRVPEPPQQDPGVLEPPIVPVLPNQATLTNVNFSALRYAKYLVIGVFFSCRDINANNYIPFYTTPQNQNATHMINIINQPGQNRPFLLNDPNLNLDQNRKIQRIQSFHLGVNRSLKNLHDTWSLRYDLIKKIYRISTQLNIRTVSYDTSVVTGDLRIDDFIVNNHSVLYYNPENKFYANCVIKSLLYNFLAFRLRHLKYNKGLFDLDAGFFTNFITAVNVPNSIFRNYSVNYDNITVTLLDILTNPRVVSAFNFYFDAGEIQEYVNHTYIPSTNYMAVQSLPRPPPQDFDNYLGADVCSSYEYCIRRFFMLLKINNKNLTNIQTWNINTILYFLFAAMVLGHTHGQRPMFTYRNRVLIPPEYHPKYDNIVTLFTNTTNWRDGGIIFTTTCDYTNVFSNLTGGYNKKMNTKNKKHIKRKKHTKRK